MPDPVTTSPAPADTDPPEGAAPPIRALIIFLAGMALLLTLDLAGGPTGRIGQDRAVQSALSAGGEALQSVADGEGSDGFADDTPGDETGERIERARSAAFFLEQANLAWRRGDPRTTQQIEREQGSAALLAFLGKLWTLGWLLLPVGAIGARFSCPMMDGRHPQWALVFGASSLGVSAGLIALALGVHGLGVSAPFVLAPLVTAIVVLNAWLLGKFARLDRAATLLRLAPILVILAAALLLAREALLRLAMLG